MEDQILYDLYETEDTKFIKYTGKSEAEEFCIPQGITEISESAFENAKIKRIIIPHGVRIIRRNAFCCAVTDSIVLPDTVEIIEESAFSGCTVKNSDIILPPSVKNIGEYTFGFCNTRAVHIPLSIETIGDFAFADSTASRIIYKGAYSIVIPGNGDRSELYETIRYIESYGSLTQQSVFSDVRNPEFKSLLAALSLTDSLEQIEFDYVSRNFISVLKYLMKNPENRNTLINTISFRPFKPEEYSELLSFVNSRYPSSDYRILLSDNSGAVSNTGQIPIYQGTLSDSSNQVHDNTLLSSSYNRTNSPTSNQAKQYISGERADITDCGHVEILFRADRIPGEIEPDSYSFTLHQNGKAIGDSDLIFFGFRNSPDGSVTDQSGSGTYSVLFRPALLSEDIRKVIVCFSVYGDGKNMNFSRVTAPFIEIKSDVNTISGKHFLSITSEKTIEAIEFYRHNGRIKMKINGFGYNTSIREVCNRYGIETL